MTQAYPSTPAICHQKGHWNVHVLQLMTAHAPAEQLAARKATIHTALQANIIAEVELIGQLLRS